MLTGNFKIGEHQSHFNSVTEQIRNGLAIYHSKDIVPKNWSPYPWAKFLWHSQMSLKSPPIYWSKNCQMSIEEILKYSNPNEIVIMCGDMNFCYREKKTSMDTRVYLSWLHAIGETANTYSWWTYRSVSYLRQFLPVWCWCLLIQSVLCGKRSWWCMYCWKKEKRE